MIPGNSSRPPAVLPGVQALRGIAAILVVASHGNLMLEHSQFLGRMPFATMLHDAGQFGVTVFFIISGFIIALVSLNEDGTPRLSPREFARRRFMRIVPFLWVCVIGYNLLSLAVTRTVEWAPMLRALAVWPVGELKPNVVWSLRHEFLFYALFALLMLGGRRRPWPLVLWFLAPLLLWPVMMLAGRTIPLNPDWPFELFSVTLLGAWGGANVQFGVGFLFGRLRASRWMRARSFGLLPPVVATIAGAVVVDALALPFGLARVLLWTVMAAVAVFLGVICRPRDGWFHRLCLKLGDSSFALYLVHNPVLLVLMTLGHRLHVVASPLFLPAIVVGAIAAGWLAHRWVERPIIAVLAHGAPIAPWLRRRRSAPRSADAGPGTRG